MAVWAIADLHLSFGVPNKKMDVFGAHWKDHAAKIKAGWQSVVSAEDLVLVPGDISWAKFSEEAAADLEWMDQLPGTKLLLKGNHDYWWGSVSKLKSILPASCHIIQNNSFNWHDITIAGTRLWDVPGIEFKGIVDFYPPEKEKVQLEKEPTVWTQEQIQQKREEDQKIYQREVVRLELSLKQMNPQAKIRIAMVHYPPVGANLQETEITRLMEKYHVDYCVFGHLHNIRPGKLLFGTLNGVRYSLVACDYQNFTPLQIL